MKKFSIFLVLLLLLGGGGYGVYDYLMGGYFFPKEEVMQEVELTEAPKTPIEDLHLAEIRSFKVPVLHNSVAVKFLVFHVMLNVGSSNDEQLIEQKMNNLVDMYIRYLVAHFEVTSVGDVMNRTVVERIINRATYEIMGNTINLKNVIIQGVYQKNAGV